MVARKLIASLALFMTLPLAMQAQNYDVGDTVTEYPMKGTYYHNRFEGRKTACGEIFNQNLFTAAHWKIKMGTYVLVTNRNTGLQVIVKVNDRCPRRGVLDMTHRAANSIGIKGCQPVTVRILPEGYEELCEAQDARFDSVYSRFASGSPALENTKAERGKSTPKDTVTAETSKPAKKENNTQAQSSAKAKKAETQHTTEQYYNLIIGTANTHGEAYEMITKLPKTYQEKARVDYITENSLSITVDVRLPRAKAKKLCRSLKQTFRDCQIAPVE